MAQMQLTTVALENPLNHDGLCVLSLGVYVILRASIY